MGMEGWNRGNEDLHDLDDWWSTTGGALTGTEYRLPHEVLQQRWRMGCKRQAKITPFHTNAGLGLFDKRAHLLPDYTFIQGKPVIIRNKQFISFLSRYPLASIYLIGGEVDGVEGEITSWRRLWTREHSRVLQSTAAAAALPRTRNEARHQETNDSHTNPTRLSGSRR